MPTTEARAIVFDADRREAPRDQVDAAALTFVQGRSEAVSCVVKDISDTGAQISVDDPTCFIPKRFKLYIEDKHILAECEQMWRKGNEVGLKFQSIAEMV